MRTLGILLKRANRQMEELAATASQTLAERNDVLARRAAGEAAIEAEAAMVEQSPFLGMGFAEYLDHQKFRLKEIDAELRDAEERHAAAKAALMIGYTEVKKLEKLIDLEDARKTDAERAREQNEADERSSQAFGRP